MHTVRLHLEQQLSVQHSHPEQTGSQNAVLGLSSFTSHWIKDFLSNHPQTVKLGHYTTSTLTFNTGVPQGCVLSPILYALYTHDCTPTHAFNNINKFADD